jgi:hypothetical protein
MCQRIVGLSTLLITYEAFSTYSQKAGRLKSLFSLHNLIITRQFQNTEHFCTDFHTLTPCILLHRTVKLWLDMNISSIINTPDTNLHDLCASRIYHIPLMKRTPTIITVSSYNLVINKSQKYNVCSQSNTSTKVCQASSVTLKWNLSQLLCRSLSFSLLWCTAW